MQKTKATAEQSDQQDIQKKNVFAFVKSQLKQMLFLRNYRLANNVEISLIFASVLFIVYYSQIFIMISLEAYNSYIAKSADITFVVSKVGFLLLKFKNQQTQTSIENIAFPLIMAWQFFCMLSNFLPVKSHQINQMLYKYIIIVTNYILYVPSIFLSFQNIFQGQNFYMSTVIILLAVLNRFIFAYFQFQLSINAIVKNMMTRNARASTNSKQIIIFLSLAIFPACNHFLHPISQIVYYLLMIAIHVNQVKQNCVGFIYHQGFISKLSGILNTFVVAASLCYLTVGLSQLQLVQQSMLSFVLAFFVFFANFFLVFKKYYTKTIVIDSDLDTPTKAVIYVTWYMSCFRNTTQKKNQLYISSLLKNHINNCFDMLCICKHRQKLYDPKKNLFGEPKWQPHVDTVFIKHFFLKILKDNSKKFPKSNQILFLLAFFNLEVIQFIPQTIQLIKVLKKKSSKKTLNISQDYALYCLAQRCYAKINELNHLRGNLNLQKVKMFNQNILKLKSIIKTSISMFCSLWKTICSQQYDQKSLVQICKKTLKIMFQIQQKYHEIKKINNLSSELKSYMILYSKLIAHDIHLLSQIRKEIRPNPQKTTTYNMAQTRSIQIFSKDTVTLITMDTNKIRWASKNCFSMFQYKNLDDFMKLRINDLMPKYFAENHDNYIQNWKDSGFTNKINKTSYLWGTTKSGYCFSLSIYIKIIPLPLQQDFAFFAALQKLDEDNQIICNQQGQIYGCGKVFSSTIRCSQKFIQDYKPNIQILMPSIFDIFLKSYYANYKSQQISVQSRFEGYFPNNIQNVFKEILRQKQIFLNKNQKKHNFSELYCHFLKEKMQQMTVHIQGQYLSFIFNINQNYCFCKNQKKIIILKISGIKRNNVQKYYNQIQKMISKLEQLKALNFQAKNKQKIYQKTIKKDYFKALLNPKRIKKLLEEEAKQRQGKKLNQKDIQIQDGVQKSLIQQSFHQSKQDISNIVSNQKMIGYRKKLALNAQHEIKNQRAKFNIWRIKKGLYDQGVISRYTYNLLVGKGSGFQSIKNFQTSSKLQQHSGTNRDVANIVIGDDMSDDDLLSDNLTKNQALMEDKPNDNQTFNSATSSAAFISMTNNIKMFKIKLRSLNTPKLLYWLNVAFVMIIILAVVSSITQTIIFKRNMEYGSLYFTKGLQSAWAIDSLLICKALGFNLQLLKTFNSSMNITQNSDLSLLFNKNILNNFDIAHSVMQLHVAQIEQYKTMDSRILQYMYQMINMADNVGDSNGQLNMLEFILREEDYIKRSINHLNIPQISQLLSIHRDVFSANIFDEDIRSLRIILFVCLFLIVIVLSIVTIPIVYKIQSKIGEIIYLISKISINQRRRYYLQFHHLNLQATKSEDFINQFNIEQYEGKSKNNPNKTNDQTQLQQKMLKSSGSRNSNQLKKQQNSQKLQKKDKAKFIESIYCRIITIYFIFLLVCSLKFIYLTIDFSRFENKGQIFNSVVFEKLKFSQRMWTYSYQLTSNATNLTSIRVDNLHLVDNIYNTYHQTMTSKSYEQFIVNVATSNVCDLINPNLMTKNSQPFLKYLLLNNESLVECSLVNNRSLSSGLFNSLYFIQSKKQQILNMTYPKRTQFIQQNNNLIFDLEKTQIYANTMIYAIQKRELDEYLLSAKSTLWKIEVGEYILGGFILLFMLAWIYVYLNIAEKASYINAFLLLIPFDVLNQNPYIKLYIRNQFDYKSSVY